MADSGNDCNKLCYWLRFGLCILAILGLVITIITLGVFLGNCDHSSAPMRTDLADQGQEKVLPSLKQPPSTIESETSYATIQWQDEYNGDGPTCGYAIDKRVLGDDDTPWTTAGFVQLEPGRQSGERHVFSLTDLEPATDYQVSVRPILCDGTRIIQLGEGPLLSLTTSRIEPPTLMTGPILTNLSTSHVVFEWGSEHHGDGPVCGYDINLKKVVDDDKELWLSVGFVPVMPVGRKLEFYIGHLEAHTSYLVAVSVINCLSGENGPRRPVLSFKTLEPFTGTCNTLSPADLHSAVPDPDMQDGTDIPPAAATETSVCSNFKRIVCLLTILGLCIDWKLILIGVETVLLITCILLVSSYVMIKQRSRNNNGHEERSDTQSTVSHVSAIQVPNNDECNGTGNTYI